MHAASSVSQSIEAARFQSGGQEEKPWFTELASCRFEVSVYIDLGTLLFTLPIRTESDDGYTSWRPSGQ